MYQRRAILFLAILLLTSCQNKPFHDDLNSLKQQFLTSIFTSDTNEVPFNFSYKLRTVFFSKEIVSLFGEFNSFSFLPHESGHYEGRTFCKINGKFKEVTFDELFVTSSQKEYVRSYCEEVLTRQPGTYLSTKELSFATLRLEDLHTYIIDDQYLIIIFQPYVVGSYMDGPFFVKIPYSHLKGRWNENGILPPILDKILVSQCFVSSWSDR